MFPAEMLHWLQTPFSLGKEAPNNKIETMTVN